MRGRRSTVTAVAGALILTVTVPTSVAAPDPCAGAPRAPYVDVTDRDTHAPAIDCLHGLRVIRGREVDRYLPASDVRRDQMATIVSAAIEATGVRLPSGETTTFTDLRGNPHRQAIEKLAAAGIVRGRSAGTFGPTKPVTRGQMATFLVGAHEHVTGDRLEDPPRAFDDTDGHTHEASIDRAFALGLASGRSVGRFDPNRDTRRDQTASFVVRLYRLLADDRGTATPAWGFQPRTTTLPGSLRRSMTGVSWHPGCPVPLDDLRLLELTFHDLRGTPRRGLLVAHRSAAAPLRAAFEAAYEARFPIHRMRLIDRYGGNDDRSMRNNNTSAFNCRRVAGTSSWSEHAFGRAVDVNPIQNPYVRGGVVEPDAGRDYLDRSHVRPGMLTGRDPIVRTLEASGWGWGGRWSSSKDYQHLSSTGR